MNQTKFFNQRTTIFHNILGSIGLLFMLAVSTIFVQAQTATIYGALGNFDIINNTGQDAHGFEVELEGVQQKDIYYTYSYQRYGSPSFIATATGVIVRWTSAYSTATQSFVQTTVAHAPNTAFAGTCYMGGTNYDNSGCEHFGISLTYPASPTRTTHRWLIANPQEPGTLVANGQVAAIPAPIYQIVPPVAAGGQPQLVAEIEAPEPAEAPETYGNAQWVRIFKTQLNREVTLDELVSVNAIVPQDPTQLEVSWDILQASPPSNGNQRRKQNQGGLDPTTRAVIRRYETYAYTGSYDPVTHKATCADGTCTAPSDGELGDFLGAQMAAANVLVNSVIVTKTGNGDISSNDKLISCGNKCAIAYNLNSVVTLTAKASSGNTFAGWTGACTGAGLTCTVTITGRMEVGAAFAANPTGGGGGNGGGGNGGGSSFTLSIGRSNSGTVTGTPNGIDRALDCGGSCSAKFAAGTVVTLTATPPAGKSFAGWGGACSGTASTCAVTITKDTSVQANFNK